MAKLSTIQISGSGTYVQVTDHASAPSPTANKLYANTTSLYWEDTDLAAGGGDAMDKIKSQGPTSDGAVTTTGLANTAVLMASGANTAVNLLFDQGTTLAGAYNAIIHIAGDCNMPGCAITSDGTNGSQTFNDLGVTDHTITAGADVHHDSGENLDMRTAGIGFSEEGTAVNDVSISFNGTGDILTVGVDGHDDFHFGTNDFTIEFWINADDIDATNGTGGALGNCQDGGVESGFALIENSGYWYFTYQADTYGTHNGTNESLLKFAVPPSGNGTWYHVAICRWDATTNNPQMVAYINGAPQVEELGNAKADHSFGKTTTDELVIGRAYANEDEKYLRIRIRNYRKKMEKEGLSSEKIIKTVNNLISANNALKFYKNKAIYKYVTFLTKNKCLINKKIFSDEAGEIVFKSFSDIFSLISGTYYPPRSKKIINLINRAKKSDFTKSTLGGCIVEKKDGLISIFEETKVKKISYELVK